MADTETFQHYQVLRRPDGSLWELGRGAMGVTYKAFDTLLRFHVALKVINAAYLDSDMARQRFLREARAAAGLNHENFATVYHLGEVGGNYFYSMEFIDGESLEAFVRRHVTLAPALALDITRQVASALRAASRVGLVHRDIKPANLMLQWQEEEDEEQEIQVKVIDFGLAKMTRKDGSEASATITVAGFVGTPHFASPEQLEEKELDGRSDIYSLGVTLWYMLTGRPPFGGSMAQIMSQHLSRQPPFEQLAGTPAVVVRLLERMLEKDPARRPQSATELRREIDAAASTLRAGQAAGATALPGAGSVAAGSAASPESSFPTQELVDGEPPDSSEAPRPEVSPATGVVLAGHYRLLRTAGRGAHGALFHALELDHGQPLALKVLSPGLLDSPAAFARVEGSVNQARAAPHPALLQMYALERAGSQTLLTCEWVNGFTLVELLRHRGALPFQEVVQCLEPLAAAADHARQAGLPTPDFSPEGVLLGFEATLDVPAQSALLPAPLAGWPPFQPKVYPFSLAAALGAQEPTWTGLQTMAPAKPPPPDALRQLALLTYELLGGNPAAPSPTQARPPLAALTERGNAVLRQALASDGPAAFPSASALVAELRASAMPARPEPVRQSAPTSAVASVPPPMPTAAPAAVVPTPLPPSPLPLPSTPPALPAAAAVPGRGRTPLLLILMLLIGFIILGIVGGASYAAWKIYVFADAKTRSARATPGVRPPVPGPFVTPAQTRAPTAAGGPLPSATPSSPMPTPAQANRAQELVAQADALDRNGDDAGALDAYTSVAEDYPGADPGLSRLDSYVSRLRANSSDAAGEALRFQRLRAPMERAARLGSDTAMLYLGDRTAKSEPAAAADWYRQAAAKGQPEAMLALGNMYYHGTGVELAPAKAVEWYRLASDKGSAKAKVYLADCYDRGIGGMPHDAQKSFELVNDALQIDPDNAIATEKLAEDYERGRGTRADPHQALILMKRAVDLGNTAAIGTLGTYYIRGLGQRADPKMAASLFKQGADKNNAACMFFYAQCLQEGLGIARNSTQAVDYYRAAAERNFPPARDWCRQFGVSFTPAAPVNP